MKKIATLSLLLLLIAPTTNASEESKTWDASEKARKFVKESIVIGFFASPHGAGWLENKMLHNYLKRSRATGITGHDMTLTAATHSWKDFEYQHQKFRAAMAEDPQNYIFVRSIRDIEVAHIRGATAVIWNTQTSTILDGDVSRVALLKELGIASMILVYNDVNKTGVGSLAAHNGNNGGLTSFGRSVIDELVRYGIMLGLSHTGKRTAMEAMDYMDEKYPGVPYAFTHSLPDGLYKDEPEATPKGCYHNITDEEALRVKKSGGFVSPTVTEWMMDGIWPDNITPQQCADMIDYYVKLLGVDHVGIASDDMFTTKPTMDFVAKNADIYDDGGYMVKAFNRGASGCGELAKILPAVTDELWKRGYSNEDIKKIYGGNKMRVYRQLWEGFTPENDPIDQTGREEFVNELRRHFQSR